jgi:AcrR family transcriptional regulator
VDKPDRQPPPSLVEEQRELTRVRIRRAAMEVVARRGFDATLDEIAQVSGVSPRTIFRHYASHDQLIAATVKDMFEVGDRPMEDLPSYTDDFDGWLEVLALTAHTRNFEILGNAFWDLHAPSRKLSEVLSELGTVRREYRRSAMHYLVTMAWQAAGGTGEPPGTPTQIGALTANILKVLLRRAVQVQRSAGGDVATDADAHGGWPG